MSGRRGTTKASCAELCAERGSTRGDSTGCCNWAGSTGRCLYYSSGSPTANNAQLFYHQASVCVPGTVTTPEAVCDEQHSTQIGALNADIGGCGLQQCHERYGLATASDCAERCQVFPGCKAYNWAPLGGDRNHAEETVCTLYDQIAPTGFHGDNQVFCRMDTAPEYTCSSNFVNQRLCTGSAEFVRTAGTTKESCAELCAERGATRGDSTGCCNWAGSTGRCLYYSSGSPTANSAQLFYHQASVCSNE